MVAHSFVAGAASTQSVVSTSQAASKAAMVAGSGSRARRNVVAAAGPGPAGPGSLTKPSMPPPARPSAPPPPAQLSRPPAPGGGNASLSRPGPPPPARPAGPGAPPPLRNAPAPQQQAASNGAPAPAPPAPPRPAMPPPPAPPAQQPLTRPAVSNPFANLPPLSAPSAPASAAPAPLTAAPPPPRPAPPKPTPPPARPQRPPPSRPTGGPNAAQSAPPPRSVGAPPRPGAPAAGAAASGSGSGSATSSVPLARPPSRPDLLPRQPASAAATTHAADGAAASAAPGELVRPDPPSLRVLEPLMGKGGRGSMDIEVVEEDDMMDLFDEEDMEFVNKGPALKSKGKKGAKRKEKVTAEMKREARRQREASRNEKAAARRRDKEEIFEVGDEGMSLHDLADLLQVDESDIVRALFMKGIAMSMGQLLDKNTVKVVAAEYDVVVVDKEASAVTDGAKKRTEFVTEEDIEDLQPRPPVVTVMGHVDHGKTSLLDHIRKARVAAGEAGGITQAIGAYNTEVEVDGEVKTICFLDTPGHEAFSAMRARGAQVTDMAIIIVAADDGVRPQTREAVAHAQAAGVPIVVAINKIDKPGADVDRVKQELLELNLVPEEWGGNTPMCPVSAKKGTGVQDLLTQLLWLAEEKSLMSNPLRPARGTVIEANLDKKRGPVATLLVQAGTLRPGDLVRAGASYGKVRSLTNDLGRPLTDAGPSIAVQLTGLNSVPAAGEEFEVHANEQAARTAALEFEEKLKVQRMLDMSGGGSMVTLASLATVDEDQEALQRLNLIIKADTSGMVEAIKAALSMLPQQSVVLRFLLSGAGDLSVSDIDLAAASGGLVLAFNLEPDEAVSSHAKRLGVNVKSYKIIYELIDDVKAAMEGKLKLVEERVPQGTAVVKAVFGTGKKRVAGCAVTEGKLTKSGYVTVKRGSGKNATVVYEGKLSSLRRVKDIVEEVSAGLECGAGCDGFTDWAEGDTLECYLLVTKSRRLEEARATTAVDVSTLA
ncbi:hypothetical protein HYH02_009685 [Chlamydomonas schloesseri]|uniref:Translation initiation factor IF-2, chloroplastic n=1 Tax=Chlamydomonas schloesseri TaxID=2026947 RepID=A0A835W8Z3_9CHLO|nr:hypothetical protein HYH02_009685 [Chlamydomonas schloesseri]|eukprot:KAG2442199.1 hypothetical protein HYH02_009685 [Chlamydomonas schloesseri]